MRRRIAVLFILLFSIRAVAAEPLLKQNDTLAICGDSITEQKLYSVFIEDYLLMCRPDLNVRSMQFGWGGETSWGFLARMDNDVLRFKPTIATTCYGMNDGGYAPLSEERGNHYRQAMTDIVKKFKDSGARVVVGSPGCVDSYYFRKKPELAEMYNKTLGQLRDIARDVAKEQGVAFADVYDPMIETMAKAKAQLGEKYAVAGGDGVHPGPNGHLVMAYAFLKALGCDGEIGTITVDLAGNKATGSPGHEIKSVENGVVTIESSRYPFCFTGDPKSPDAARGILAFLPFSEDLNQFKLIVTGGSTDRYKITWGDASKDFSASELRKGINLAAEFFDNPFCERFQTVESAIRAQQNHETPMIKKLLHPKTAYNDMSADQKSEFDKSVETATQEDLRLATAARDDVKPVTHVIKIEAVK